MKKLICLAVILVAMFTLMGCGGGSSSSGGGNDAKVIFTNQISVDTNDKEISYISDKTDDDYEFEKRYIKTSETDNKEYIAFTEVTEEEKTDKQSSIFNDEKHKIYIQNKTDNSIYSGEGTYDETNEKYCISDIKTLECPGTFSENSEIKDKISGNILKIGKAKYISETKSVSSYTAYPVTKYDGSGEAIETVYWVPEIPAYIYTTDGEDTDEPYEPTGEYDTLPLAKDIDEPFWLESVEEGYEPEFDQIQLKILPTDNPDYIALIEYYVENDYPYCETIQNVKTRDVFCANGHFEGEGENRYFAIDEIRYKLCPGKLQPNTIVQEDEYRVYLGEKVNVTVKDKTYSAYEIEVSKRYKDIYYFVPEMCYYVKYVWLYGEMTEDNEKVKRLSGRYNK